MAIGSAVAGPSLPANQVTRCRAVCVIAPNAFDREAVVALLRESVSICHESCFVHADTSPAVVPLDLIVVFWVPGDLQALVQVERLIRNGAKSPLLVVIANERESLTPLRNLPLMGVFAKTEGPEKFSEAVRAVAAGGTYFSEGVQLSLQTTPGNGVSLAVLSQRERDLLPLLAEGLSLRDAAARLGIGYKTADAHRTSLFRKLGVRDRVSLVRLAIREGLAQV